MAEITVVSIPQGEGWTCTVQVSEKNGQTRHSVTLSQKDLVELSGSAETSPEELVKKSFEYLLERESKESILRQFSLPGIEQYFPEYTADIRKRL